MADKILMIEKGEETYHIPVNVEDYERAQNDIEFASTLLYQYKKDCRNQDRMDSHTITKNVWRYNEVIALIDSMASHIKDLSYRKKRKYVFNNVENNLISKGIAVNAQQCTAKWKSLLRSYRSCKDAAKTGRGPSRFLFFDKLDELLGDRPSSKCEHTLESGTDDGLIVATLDVDETLPVQSILEKGINEIDSLDTDTASGSRTQKPTRRIRRKVEKDYLKTLIKLKEEEYKKRENRHTQLILIEERKIALLEQLLEK